VPYNGVVVFDHLPQARLKFVFNRQAWSLTLKPNPDGTKKGHTDFAGAGLPDKL